MVNETQAPASSSAFSFISKSWRDVRVSADADFQLIRNRANSFKNLATSFDRELENFINTASTFSVPAISSSTPAEIDFVKKLQPKLSEFRRTYSAPDFSKRVLEKWGPRGSIRIDLSAIKNAIVPEVEDRDGIVDFDRVRRGRRVRFRNFGTEEVKEKEKDYWEPIRAFKTRLREFERRSSSTVDIFEGWKSGELVEKVKSSLKAICKDPEDSKEVPPLDVPELLACLVRQSEPFLDQLGVKKDLCEKIVENLCSKRKHQFLQPSLSGGETSIVGNDNISDELDL
ncbi:hypothetical protein CRG98_044332, partial [Punica granatum]